VAQALTGIQLIATVRWRADIESMTLRHTDTIILDEINKSWIALRTKVSDLGSGLYLKWASGTLTAGASAGHSFGTLNLPSDCVRIYAFDVTLPGGEIVSLSQCTLQERNAYRDQWNRPTGRPQFFFVSNIGTESTTSVTAGTINLVPAPDSAYAYSLGYLPAWTPITNTSYVFDSFDGWADWVVWDVVLKIAARENDMLQTAAIAAAEREKAWIERILPDVRVNRSGPIRRADTAAQSRAQRYTMLRRGP
jgi:hypothetical protein